MLAPEAEILVLELLETEPDASPADVAEAVGCSARTVYRIQATGRLRTRGAGSRAFQDGRRRARLKARQRTQGKAA
jgi:hypothetical protein